MYAVDGKYFYYRIVKSSIKWSSVEKTQHTLYCFKREI